MMDAQNSKNFAGQCQTWAWLPASRRSREKLRNFTKGEIREFSSFPFSLQLIVDEILSNVIVFLMIF